MNAEHLMSITWAVDRIMEAAIPIATNGKFRLHRCTVVGEKDLKEIGLTEEAKMKMAATFIEGRKG